MPMFPAISSASSSSSSSSFDLPSRRARCFARLAGTRVEVYLRDNVNITGILSVHGNSALYPRDWGDLTLSSEELATAVRYTRGSATTEDGWRTVVGRRTRKPQEGKFDKLGKQSHDYPMLWLRNAQKRPSGSVLSSPVYPLLAITWRDIQGLSGTLQDDVVASNRKPRFQTDNQISAMSGWNKTGEKILEKWTDDMFENNEDWPSLDLAEDNRDKQSWNQFEENSRMFGVKTTYDEGLYTTELNVTEIPEDVQRRAAEIASEMNGGKYKDEDDDEEDEEKKFSAVAGSGAYAHHAPKRGLIVPPPPSKPITAHPLTTTTTTHGGAPHILRKAREDAAQNHLQRKDLFAKQTLKRLPKDNINALNLEPIKPSKRTALSRTNWKADKLPNRQKTLEEFSQSAQAIQEKMEKKGWTSPSISCSAPAGGDAAGSGSAATSSSAAQGTSTAISAQAASASPVSANPSTSITAPTVTAPPPPLSSSAQIPDQSTNVPLPPPSNTAPVPPPSPSGGGRRDDSFQFNPNAHSFTPKGEPLEKPSPAADQLATCLNNITQSMLHSTTSCYALPTWAPRFQVSYIDCLAAPPAAYAPYPYATDYPMMAWGVTMGGWCCV